MQVVTAVAEYTDLLRQARAGGRTIGLVPTMGALHDGHRALVGRAAAECDLPVVSIFVNPLQFGDPDDLARYPRTLATDLAVCEAAGVALVLVPTVDEMYPAGLPAPVSVSVSDLGECWEGRDRVGHFDGVATVVTKLFSMTGHCRAYFGEKDFQQLVIVRRLARELCLPVEVVGCPTVRERDGLALSSRNVRLSAAERTAATSLSAALAEGCRAVVAGERRPGLVAARMAEVLEAVPLVEPAYAAVVDAADLAVPPELDGRPCRLLVAAQVGPVRLIDNCAVPRPDGPGFGVDHRPALASAVP